MLTSSFANPVIKLNLPNAVQQDLKQNEHIVVSVDRTGKIFIGSDPVGLEEFGPVLRGRLSLASQRSIHLRGDEEMPYRILVQVMDEARRAGADQINIVHKSHFRSS